MKRHAHIVATESLPHQQSWGGAFGEGLKRHGWFVTHAPVPQSCDLLVMWGVRHQPWIAAQKAAGGEVCILERGYVGDRFAWTSVSFGGGLNGRGIFHMPGDADASRWERHFAQLMRPWDPRPICPSNRTSAYALLIGQVPGDNSLRGVDIDAWYRDTAAEAARVGWPVRFRPHPVAVQRGIAGDVAGAPTLAGSLDEALAGAAACITWNSNTAVESVLAGVPTIACDEGSMAWPVCGHAVGPIPSPDRRPWVHWLAWCQWTIEEMRSGDCWAAVGARLTQ
jgi:hypothetical protein